MATFCRGTGMRSYFKLDLYGLLYARPHGCVDQYRLGAVRLLVTNN